MYITLGYGIHFLKKIAIVGSGISGLTCSYLLKDKYEVSLFEASDYFGGHSNTVSIDIMGKNIPVDTGFIVFNHLTYPNLIEFFKELNVSTKRSDMSFGISIDNGTLEYCGSSINRFFAMRKNIFNVQFIKLAFEITRFNKHAAQVNVDSIHNLSLEEYIAKLGLSINFRNWYLYPMTGAIWSTPVDKVGLMPASTFITFFRNHGLLSVTNHPQWYTVDGGSSCYVAKALASDKIIKKINSPVINVWRQNDKIKIATSEQKLEFDHIIFASPAHKTHAILKDASQAEHDILSQFKYSKNIAYLHRDPSLMPKNKRAWASWNYFNSSHGGVGVTYWMNALQKLDTNENIFVTLNPALPPDKDLTYKIISYEHPIFDQQSVTAQSKINQIQGQNNTWFCGSYWRYGFHEDGIWSALRVVNSLGVKAKWQ